jgi:hypothetical protein
MNICIHVYIYMIILGYEDIWIFSLNSLCLYSVIRHIENDHWMKVMDYKNLDARMTAATEWLELITQLSLVKTNMTDIIFKTKINFYPVIIPSCYESEKSMARRRYLDHLWFDHLS